MKTNGRDRTETSPRAGYGLSRNYTLGGIMKEKLVHHKGHEVALRENKSQSFRSGLEFTAAPLQRAHVCEELAVPSCLAEFVDQQFHGFHRRERVQYFA